MVNKAPNIRAGFSLGAGQAETDPLLHDAFIESGDYQAIQYLEDPRCFIVGRTGSGKSAALQRLEETRPDHVIRINPESLSLPYITNVQVFRYLDDLEVRLDPLWIALWKHVLLVEIIRKRYNVTSNAAKQTFLQTLRERIKKDPAKQQALEYLDEFEGRFWCEADERVKEITSTFTNRINAETGGSAGVPGLTAHATAGGDHQATTQERTQLQARFQHIVNEAQLPRLNKMIEVLDEEILDSSQNYMYVVIDDLDRDWIDERLANDLIRCLFRTTMELQRVQNLKVLVALRTNIFQQLDFGVRSGGQEEKFRDLVLRMRWTRNDLKTMLNERVAVASRRSGLEPRTFTELLPPTNKKRGNALTYMFDRTLLRPRDAIAFANECLRIAAGKRRISWADIQQAEHPYSHDRLLALRDEWKASYPGIEMAIEQFRGAPERMGTPEFQDRLDECMLLLSNPNFPGSVWMTDLSGAMWTPGGTWFELYQPLTKLLYAVGLIGCCFKEGAEPTYYLDDELLVESERMLENCTEFVVHPAYRPALDVVSE